MSNILEQQIEKDLEQLKEILATIDAPPLFDPRLHSLASTLLNNPGSFVTVAPTCLKIRTRKNERLAKVDADFIGVNPDIVLRLKSGMRNRDLAYMFLLALKANDQFDLVKFNYRGAEPRAKEISAIEKLREQINTLTVDGSIEVRVGTETAHIDGVMDIPNNPKADFVLTLGDEYKQFYISHKDLGFKPNMVDSFRQYSGVSTFCLGSLAKNAELYTFIEELKTGFTSAGIEMKDLRKGSYFAKKIEHPELIRAALFGREWNSQKSDIHNIDAVVQGDVQLIKMAHDVYDLRATGHVLLHPKHNSGVLDIPDEFEPHFMATKSVGTNQFFESTRIAIWPKNTAVKKGLSNFKKFFIDKDYSAFRKAVEPSK